jgi:pyruvate dehydrogenase E2 component (dihydrolipoamide acetyltransferase)
MEDLSGGTFTITNLGAFGIESFTPVLNAPEVAILGVSSIEPRAVMDEEETRFVPHLGLSLTIDHQAVDGAPGARFLQELCRRIAAFETVAAL